MKGLTAWWAVVLALPAAAESPLRPADFAYGYAIETAAEAPFYELSLPRPVYESVTRADLGDLRVFNARDEVVPHALRRPEPAREAGEWSKLALFPVRAVAGRAPDAVSLRVDRNAAGSIVRVQTTDGAPAQAAVAFYIVETKRHDQSLRTLEVDWKDSGGEGFAGRLSVDGSDDLKSWRTLVSEAPVLRLRMAGESLDRRQIEVNAVKTKYLRLRWVETEGVPALSSVRAEYAREAAPPERLWLPLEARVGEQPGEFLFAQTGNMPVDRVRIRLPQANAVASAELFSRVARGDPWQRRAGGLVYRVDKGGADIHQDDFVLAPVSGAREWRLTLSQKDGGLGAAAPGVELGWLPHALVFAARGAGPYRLAYGKAGGQPGDASIEKLLAEKRDGEPKFATQPARLGARETLGGDPRLSLTLRERSWRTWLLWAALGAGVLLLGWMATRLARQMKPQA